MATCAPRMCGCISAVWLARQAVSSKEPQRRGKAGRFSTSASHRLLMESTATRFTYKVFRKSLRSLDLQSKSLAYTAPEVLRKESFGGAPADLWALGCILGAFLRPESLPFGSFFTSSDQFEELKMEISKIDCSVRRDALEILLDVAPTRRGTAEELLWMARSLKLA